ncbi:hypothetical protein DXG01_002927, partial [Tephrocybe rancida]
TEKARSEAYVQIDIDIELMKRTILKLKSRRNSLSLIARLPPEVLGRIFKWLPSMEGKESYNTTPWWKVSFVCTYWRRVALNCPELWSFLRNPVTECIKTLITRSCTVPLSVDTYIRRRRSLGGLSLILGEIHRVRELTINDSSTYGRKVQELISGLTSPAPLLESFSIRREVSHSSSNTSPPDRLFADVAPRLKKIYLQKCILPLDVSLLFSSLKILSLDSTCAPAGFYSDGLSSDRLLDILEFAPNLTHLTLDNAFTPAPPDQQWQAVNLSRLEELEITASIPCLIEALTRITHPTATHVEAYESFLAHPGPNRLENIRTMGTLIAARVSTVRTVRTNVSFETYSVTFSGYVNYAHVPHRPNAFKIKLCYSDEEDILPPALFTNIPMSKLEYLSISGLPVLGPVCRRAFGDLPNLKVIHILRDACLIVGLSARDEAPEESTLPPAGSNDDEEKLSFRSLHTLTIQKWTLHETGIAPLKDWLSHRSTHDSLLPKLRVFEGRIRGTEVELRGYAEELRPLVEEVEWEVTLRSEEHRGMDNPGRIHEMRPKSSDEMENLSETDDDMTDDRISSSFASI